MDPLRSDLPQSAGTGLTLHSTTLDAMNLIKKYMAEASISTTFPGDTQRLCTLILRVVEDIKGVKHHQSEFKEIAHEIAHLGIVAIGRTPATEGATIYLNGYVKSLTSLLTDIHDLSCKCRQSSRKVAMIWVPIKIQGYRKKLRHSLQKLSVALQMETNHVVDQTQRDLRAKQPDNPPSPANTQPAEPRVEWHVAGSVFMTNVNGDQNNSTYNFAHPGTYGTNFGLPGSPPRTTPPGFNSAAVADNGESN
ncbi:hypothetical protein B0H11DRAFT_834460 [Mycena galericulata]|nr:hypothetical protein B0H11DRAFT_834460 [Mycena galericulata]